MKQTLEKLILKRCNNLVCSNFTVAFCEEILCKTNSRYGLPVMVTENGMANDDTVSSDGGIHDKKRIDFMKEYLSGVKRAVNDGINVLGYQHWSLMDNFEWTNGYAPRFGIIHIDYKTQKRTIKDSGYFYKEVIKSDGEII